MGNGRRRGNLRADEQQLGFRRIHTSFVDNTPAALETIHRGIKNVVYKAILRFFDSKKTLAGCSRIRC